MVDNDWIVKKLNAFLENPKSQRKLSTFIDIDCGYHRSGTIWNSEATVSLVREVINSSVLSFAGLYVHCGDSYNVKDMEMTVSDVQNLTIDHLIHLADRLKSLQIEVPLLSTGSTPSCSQPCDKFSYVQEMHPGNYIFYDAQQFLLGSCQLNEIACTVATRVVGHYPSRNELLIDCGFSALTKQGEDRLPSGYVIFPKNPELKLTSMTQELGKITSLERINYSKYPIGKILFMYPYHSCATAALYDRYYIHENFIVTDIWKPCRGW
uniref:D-serine dehydratase-like domain-containing protein n=1 Tax=Romanomermis culicivorax TaxID=13658 RepID=A0A915IMC7_ROMCU